MGAGTGAGSGCGRTGGRKNTRCWSSSSLLLLNFIFTACEKFHKVQFHFPFLSPPRYLVSGGPVSSPPPLQSLCSHNLFLLSLEKQRKRYDGEPNKLFVRRKTITKISTQENEKVRLQKCLHRRIIFCIRRKKYFTAAGTMHETILHFLHTLLNSYILYII